jgi:arylsulfatase A-like enzyme
MYGTDRVLKKELRIAVLFLVLLLASFWVNAAPVLAQQSDRPNFLFLFADDLGWGDLGCYGNTRIQTPYLDQLAEEGALFTQFYVNAPVCAPSRMAAITGHFPARHGIHEAYVSAEYAKARGMPPWLDSKVHTLPRLLREQGYTTGHFGKWGFGIGKDMPTGEEYGFDMYPRNLPDDYPRLEPNDPYSRSKSSGVYIDQALQFMQEQQDRPFYINLWFLTPHSTLNPTDEEMEPYQRLAPGVRSYRGANQIYYATVTSLDRDIGRLLKRMSELGLSENTVVFFSSDNGPEISQIRGASHSAVGEAGPFRGRKRSLYEGGVRMPFIVRWPNRIPEGHVDRTSVLTAVDLLPTLCGLGGVGLPVDLQPDGEDVGDIWAGHPRTRTKPIMWERRSRILGHILHASPMLAIRDGDWKLLMNPDRSRVELYNIPRDPTELNNQANHYPDMVDRMSKTALEWQKTLPEGPVERAAGSANYPWP